MNMHHQALNFIARRLLLALCLGAPVLPAHAANCPADTFEDFVEAYANQPQLRQAHTRLPLTLRQVALEKNEVIERRSTSMNPWPLLDNTPGPLEVVPRAPDTALLRDTDGKILRILAFTHQDCWTLTRLEDWSLGVLDDTSEAAPGAAAYQRGDRYKALAMQERSSSNVPLYEAALASYLQGAREGSPKAAYAAAGLSLSGEAPRLDNARIQSLLESAAPTLAEAGLTLANFYCDEGNYDEQRPCANPQSSLQALQSAARLGLPEALAELGGAYAAGTIVQRDLQRALTCYQQAQAEGTKGLEPSIERLKSQGITLDNTVHCL